jgi:hypothetical protein
MRLDFVHPAAEKITLVLERIGDDKIQVMVALLLLTLERSSPANMGLKRSRYRSSVSADANNR